jgi:hypothetical protein
LKRCSLPVSVRGRLATNSISRGYLKGAMRGLDVVLQRLGISASPAVPGLEHAEGLDDHAALVVGLADDAAFGHGRVLEQRVLHLGPPTL